MSSGELFPSRVAKDEGEPNQLVIDKHIDCFNSSTPMAFALGEDVKDERVKIRKFITTYRNLPVLWDVKCFDYTKREKRNAAYDILLQVFRGIKYDGTVEDVKKKINSMRSNFRKELKRVEDSANAGIIYRPSSWMYEELMFLKDLESHFPSRKSFATSEESNIASNHEAIPVDSEVCHVLEQCPTNKKRRCSEVRQKHTQPPVFNPADIIHDGEENIIRVWASKLKNLDHMQRLFAEKAINDVLFEAQLGTLHRNSVIINKCTAMPVTHSMRRMVYDERLQPSQSSPEYKYSETEEFRQDDN